MSVGRKIKKAAALRKAPPGGAEPIVLGKISPEQAAKILQANALLVQVQQDPTVLAALTRFELAKANLALAVAEAERDNPGVKLNGVNATLAPDGTITKGT